MSMVHFAHLSIGLFLALFLFIYLFLFWLNWVFVAVCRLSIAAVQGLLVALAFLTAEHGFQDTWAQ